MNPIYKLEFELVQPLGQGLAFYDATGQPTAKVEDVPDQYWTKTSRETDSPWQQFNQLKEWVANGTQLIRNVRLYKAISEPQWELVESR